MTCQHFHRGALACKLSSLPCTGDDSGHCSLFEPSSKKKTAHSKIKKVSVIKESKIKKQDKKEKDISKKQIPILTNKSQIDSIKSQILSTFNSHKKGNTSNQQLFNELQLYLTRLHPLCITK